MMLLSPVVKSDNEEVLILTRAVEDVQCIQQPASKSHSRSLLAVQEGNNNNSSSTSLNYGNEKDKCRLEEHRRYLTQQQQWANPRLHPIARRIDTSSPPYPICTLGTNYLRHQVMRKSGDDRFCHHRQKLSLRYQPYRVESMQRHHHRCQHAYNHQCPKLASRRHKCEKAKCRNRVNNVAYLTASPIDSCRQANYDYYDNTLSTHTKHCQRDFWPREVQEMLIRQQRANNTALCRCCCCTKKRSGCPNNENVSNTFHVRRGCLGKDNYRPCNIPIVCDLAQHMTQHDPTVYPGTERSSKFFDRVFLCRPAEGFAEVNTRSVISKERHQIGRASKGAEENLKKPQNDNQSWSRDTVKVNGSLPIKPRFMIQVKHVNEMAEPTQNIKETGDKIDEHLFKDSNENHQTFKFSSPDVILSKSRQKLQESLSPFLPEEDENTPPSACCFSNPNISPQQLAVTDTLLQHRRLDGSVPITNLSNLRNMTSKESPFFRDSSLNSFCKGLKLFVTNPINNMNDSARFLKLRGGEENETQSSKSQVLDTIQVMMKRDAGSTNRGRTSRQGNPIYQRNTPRPSAPFNYKECENSKDVTSNNNNELSWPINNNSCVHQRAHAQQGPLSLGGRVIRVEGDGRCLFRSLVTAEYPPLQVSWRDEFGRPVNRELAEFETSRADDLRGRVVSIMADNMHFYSQLERGIINADQPLPSSYQRFMDRLRAMSNPTTMPGDLELNAVAMVMERQIFVLNTNLAIITSYGHDRFPQSVPLAVRYTRLVADVGHYDAVILNDDVSSGPNDQSEGTSKGDRQESSQVPAADSSRHSVLCGDFQRLNTKGDETTNKDSSAFSPKGRGGGGGDAKLNAKKEFFYLRDSDKILHSEGLLPVSSIATKDSAPRISEQKTADATTSTARAAVYWPSVSAAKRASQRRKRRTFMDKHTQTENEYSWPCTQRQRDRLSKMKKRTFCQQQSGTNKTRRVTCGKKRRAGVAVIKMAQKVRKEAYRLRDDGDGNRIGRYQNINWNSRAARHFKKFKGRIGRPDELLSENLKLGKSERSCPPKVKENQQASFLANFRNSYSDKLDIGSNGKVKRLKSQLIKPTSKRVWTRNTPCCRRGLLSVSPANDNVVTKRKSPATYISICSPNRQPRVRSPGAQKSGAPSFCGNARRGKSMSGRNRSQKKRVRPLSPSSPRSPLFLPKRPKLPSAFEPVHCRCVLCNSRVEVSAKDSVKCYLCGGMAHRACVLKETPGSAQGGGDQNYFLCSFCVTL